MIGLLGKVAQKVPKLIKIVRIKVKKATLKRSKTGLEIQIIATGFLAILLCVFSFLAFSFLLGWTPNEGFWVKATAVIVILVGWAVSSLKLYLDWNAKRYEITDDAFIVHGKAGRWGSSKAIYRYDSIISVKMTQGYWGKKYDYGNVRLTIPKLDKDIVMYDIEHPLDQLAAVQKQIDKKSSSSNSLVT